jgi:hypothetical protein
MMPAETTNPPSTPATTGVSATQPIARRAGASRYSLIFGVALTVVTVLALIVAFLSSNFRPRASNALPASWTQVYSADLTGSDTGAWDETQNCSMTALGLDADPTESDGAICAFTPSIKQSVTANGFYFVTTLAPASHVVSNFARAVISIGDISASDPSGSDAINFVVGQDGSYVLCDSACSQFSSSIYESGGLAAWHGDALVANTVAIKVSPDHNTLTVYVNDQEVATVAPQLGPQPAIALGAPIGDEAIFTHAALYVGQ